MCNNFPNIKVVKGNAFALLMPLKKRTFESCEPIDEDIDSTQLTDLVVKFGGVQYQASTSEDGVQIIIPADIAVGTYSIVLTAMYQGSAIRAAYESAVTIVDYNSQSDAQQYIAGSPIVLDAAYVIGGTLTDAELEALKEEYREKNAQLQQAIEDAEEAKREWEQKAADLDGVAQEATSQEILTAVENIDIDTSDLAKQDTLLEVKQATNDTIASQQTTIASQSERILAFDGEVADAYDYLESKGAVMPEDKDIENLPATIEQVVGAVTDMRVAALTIDSQAEFVDVSHIVLVGSSMFGNVSNRHNIRSWKGYRVPGLLNTAQQFINCIYLSQGDFTESDTSNVTNMSTMFRDCSALQSLDLSGFNTSNVTNMNAMLRGCSSLQSLDLSSFNTANVTDMSYMFNRCSSLQSLDLTSFNTANVTNISWLFELDGHLQTLVGGMSYEDVVSDNISVFKGLNISTANTRLQDTQIDRASIRAIINGLADRTGQSALTLTIGATLIAKLSAEDIAVATSKNWTIA